MADLSHPSPDDVADLHEGLLSEDRARELLAHIESCETCTASMAALDQVQSMLATSGASPLTMPAPVADALDEALRRASLERANGVASLSDRRTRSDPEPATDGRRGRWLRGLAAAAAVVVVGFGAVTALDHLGGSSNDSASSTPDRSQEFAAGGAAGESINSLPRLTPKNLAHFGSSLLAFRPAASGPTKSPLRYPSTDGSVSHGHGWISTSPGCTPGIRSPETTLLASWKGSRATVAVYPKTRRVAVYACGRPLVQLYSTSY